ncbi:sporulation integral membrane protein YtvI [Paenibacillus validus]|uniref:Sporulation integral membrane protein YtvI n=2 Tax=Bacteria TaxID=2 RepID=A0A7X2ZAQ1_9BACL|nr:MULTISPECIES: sporulation integral membrane protein YtvI [Paenibacillus]MED4603218.1 sporulation integral membrane protein YtvI [Paenibacillus validus]MED4609393.1 sporulation integral membrane protein YtvI [Paenibacillus validus]MUG71460.1 sporulation integral membrane protein YtvI [Paenibacillus validus]
MIPFYRKYYKTIIDIALLVLTVYLFMFAFSHLYRIATPIFLAFVIYLIIEPFAKFLNRRGLKKSIASAISTLVFVMVILGAMTGLGAIFTTQIINLADKLPDYAVVLEQELINRSDQVQSLIGTLPVDLNLVEKAKEYSAEIIQKTTEIARTFLTSLFAMLTSFSTFVVNFVIGIILAYFLSIEIESWKRIASDKTPKTFKKAFHFLRENVLLGIVTYLKAQAKLISLTFIVIFIALLILNVNNAFSIALLAAIFDVLPLLGVSTLFIPWIIYLLVVGQTTLAIWLAVLLVVVIGTRQILEPKITGDSLGVSAFTMLSFMIVSLSLFGVAGLILSPVLIILVKALYEQGYLKRWIRMPAEEYEPDPSSIK